MSTLNADRLDSLFRGYGFDSQVPHESVRVYLRAGGYFQNAEIVPLTPDAPIDEVVDEFVASGYACKVSKFKSIEEAKLTLFNGFFQQEATAARLQREYEQFCSKTTRALGSPYEYITAPYLLDGAVPEGGKTITEAIAHCLTLPGPVLVFLEAAAGFGKTCTAFEMLHFFLKGQTPVNPILAELQRNRQARIFRYVLLDEMDRNYQACGLTSDMVQREIKTGRIPLIIDGFDELLHLDREGNADGQFMDVEPMLRTLAGILEQQAKVLVTTRRTAVLGEQFDDWLADIVAAQKATAFRFTLQEPRIDDWITKDRRREIEKSGVPLRDIANPVLLSFLRTVKEAEFQQLCGHCTGLVDKYFESLLDRERSRQELPLSSERQFEILKTIASSMLQSGSCSLPREELRRLVLDAHYETLRDSLRSAPDIAAKTPEELADKLTDHALLDRKRGRNAGIGFVNDFVGGTMKGMAMLERAHEEWFDESDMDKAVTAFQFRESEDRIALWERLGDAAQAVEPSWQVRFDLLLQRTLKRSLSDCMLQDISFSDCTLGSEHALENVVFMRCSFTSIIFHAGRMLNVGFVDCTLRDCSTQGNLDATHAWFDRGCSEFDGTVAAQAAAQPARSTAGVPSHPDFAKVVLEQFWPPGRAHARRTLQLRTLYQGIASHDRKYITDAVDLLKSDGLVTIVDKLARLDIGRMSEIRRLLGR